LTKTNCCWTWAETGLLTEVWGRLIQLSHELVEIDWEPSVERKKGDFLGRGYKGNGTTTMVLMDGDRIPLGVLITAANESEVNHVERLLEAAVVPLPERIRLLYDGATDNDPLRERLAKQRVELVCRHRGNRVKPPTQDGRILRRIKHRWKIERTNAWLQCYGRIAIRKDRFGSMFLGWVQLGCLFVILKRF